LTYKFKADRVLTYKLKADGY